MFKSDLLSGTSRLLFKHAYYDTAKWEKILKDMFTEKTLIETAQAKDGPRVVIISAAINLPTLQPFAFRYVANEEEVFILKLNSFAFFLQKL